LNDEFFFKQIGPCCGVCVVNTVLKMFKKPGVIFSISPIRGTSPKRIMRELRKAGLEVESKKISIRSLKPKSILWYPPPSDHYVVVGEIFDSKALIYDSAKNAPYWLDLAKLKRRWYGTKPKGWVIEIRNSNGKP